MKQFIMGAGVILIILWFIGFMFPGTDLPVISWFEPYYWLPVGIFATLFGLLGSPIIPGMVAGVFFVLMLLSTVI